MAPTVPTRQPDQQMTQARPGIQASPDAFGASIGRALVSAGANISEVAGAFKEQEQKQAASNVTDAYTQATEKLRNAQFDPDKGLLNRTGVNAEGITDATKQTSETIFAEISGGLKTDEERQAFKDMWRRKSESAIDGSAEYEFRQRSALRQERKVSGLANLQSDVVANYKNPKALAANFDAARAIIRSNSEGMSPEGVEKLEREGISSLHASVVQRLVQDNPGEALDYYEKHKAEVEGPDHASISSMIKGVSTVRQAKTATDEIANSGPAITIYKAVEAAESNGQGDAEGFRASPSGQRAQGLMQLMPDTAREAAVSMGMPDIAGKTDKELGEFFATPEGQAANRKIGAFYLNKQIIANKGDLEAALIAYNAGPANATKFLNGGRDYASLPRGSETYSYVKKVMGAYLGVDLSAAKEDEGSAGIQRSVNPSQPGARYQGDANAFLLTKLTKGKDQEHITAMQPIMRDSMAAMFEAAPDDIKKGLGILSGTRTVARQQQLWDAALKKYGSPAAARKWVAPPGKSQHNGGNAADLSWDGDYFSKAPPDVQKWVHENAKRFGLTFPLPNEAWHIEAEGARDPNKKTSRFASDVATQRINKAFTIDTPGMPGADEAGGTVVSDGATPSPAAIYSNTFQPYTVQQTKSDINDWMAAAEERYADNPPLLAEVQRQLTDKYKTAVNGQKQQVDDLQKQMYAKVLSGEKVQDMSRDDLLAVGEDNVGKLMKIEEKFSKADNPDETDESTYIELSRKTPEELRDLNLMDYADRLSRADLKSWADKQAAASRPASRDTASAGMRTRTQIVSGAVDTLGLDPKPGSADAKTVALLDRSVDERLSAYAAENGKPADAIETQKIVDQLVMEGSVSKNWAIDDTKMVFELTPEERLSFTPNSDRYAGSVTDIPQNLAPAVAQAYKRLRGIDPPEEGAVQMYNDMVKIELGATPAPPEDLTPKIRQVLAAKLGRAPTAEESAKFYRLLILNGSK